MLDNVNINGYCYYETKSTSHNRGVGFYVKNSLVSRLRPNLSFNCSSFETVWVELENKNAKNCFGCFYRHPSSDIDILLDYFISLLSKLTCKLLMEDFNIDLLKHHSNTSVNEFINFCFLTTTFHV